MLGYPAYNQAYNKLLIVPMFIVRCFVLTIVDESHIKNSYVKWFTDKEKKVHHSKQYQKRL